MMTSSRVIVAPAQRSISVDLPPSKSYTNRALIASALASGTSVIRNPSGSQDTQLLRNALTGFGIRIGPAPAGLVVHGCAGKIPSPGGLLRLGNAGTAMRFLAAFASLAPGETVLTGDGNMLRRPVGELVDALKSLGAGIECRNGFPPVRVSGGALAGGEVRLGSGKSSQFLSSLLLVAPYMTTSVRILPDGPVSSHPYVGMTLQVMRAFGASVEESGGVYRVGIAPRYSAREYMVEPDLSSATYFAAAAAVSGGRVMLRGIDTATLQGDLRFFSIIRRMGCAVEAGPAGTEVRGGSLGGVREDMNDIPDSVPALAVMAAFASGPSTLMNIGHLRYKETDRLAALACELQKIGAAVRIEGADMTIVPGPLRPGVIETYRDHRMAMSFAAAGLALPGLEVIDPGCVEKSFPGFWNEFDKFY